MTHESKTVRILTVIWVSISNLFFAYVLVRQVVQETELYRLLETRMPRKLYLLPVLLISVLLFGIVLELLDSRAALFVNLGFFLVAFAIAVLGITSHDEQSQFFGRVLGVPLFVVAAMDALIYFLKARRNQAIKLTS